jgi:hypothetical protein
VTTNDFQQRLHHAGQQIYARIENGDVTDVEAELMQAHLDASTTEGDDA